MKSSSRQGPAGADPVVYEVRLRIDNAILADFERWLPGHIEQMLALPGFESAATFAADPPDDMTSTRIVRYRLESRGALESYLQQHAERMRADGAARFGDRFSATREIYPAEQTVTPVAGHRCQNCNAALRGQYCAECGQRDKHRIISLWELSRDVVGDLFELDSRVWRTLIPLLTRPGKLTVEYLRGRRVRYTPPFRLYLVTSLVFFLVAFFGSGEMGASFNLDDVVFDDEQTAQGGEAGTPVAVLRDSPPGDDGAPDTTDAPAATRPPPGDAASPRDAAPPRGTADEEPAADRERGLSEKCESIQFGEQRFGRLLEARARRACERLTSEGGPQRFITDLVDNVPGMMFLFLPIIALVMKFLYPFARRFYVEHLLFIVHFHAFFFVLATMTLLLSRIPEYVPGQGVASGMMTLTAVLYTPVYLFIAMRRVYGQSRFVTALKFTALMGAYFLSLLTLIVLVMLITALSI